MCFSFQFRQTVYFFAFHCSMMNIAAKSLMTSNVFVFN